MATDFWASSHNKRWAVDRISLRQARTEDMHYTDDPQFYDYLNIFFANVISKFGKKLGLRQRVIATATVFFRRFYLKNSYCETEPFIVIAACCYVAAKAEESPVHIKTVTSEARTMFSHDPYNVKHFPSDTHKLAEMEFYLIDDLECNLTVFHPYRTLLTLCCKEGSAVLGVEAELGELGAGVDDGPRYWGTGEGRLELHESALQMAWLIINDTYRSDICLIYQPHMIAIAAIYLTLALHHTTKPLINPASSQPEPSASNPSAGMNGARRSSRTHKDGLHPKKPPQDAIGFLAGLNVSMPQVATIAQEIIALYTLWARFREDGDGGASLPSSARAAFGATPARSSPLTNTPGKRPHTPAGGTDESGPVTPLSLVHTLARMREAHFERLVQAQIQYQLAQTPTTAHTPTGVHASGSTLGTSGMGRRIGVAVNKRLERAQAAG